MTSGLTQAAVVFTVAALFNLPRWFEYVYDYKFEIRNQTLENGTEIEANVSVFSGEIKMTELRKNEIYIREEIQ